MWRRHTLLLAAVSAIITLYLLFYVSSQERSVVVEGDRTVLSRSAEAANDVVSDSDRTALTPLQSRPTLTIFGIPKPFKGYLAMSQRTAIKSWLSLRPRPRVILFGNGEGIAEACKELGIINVPDIPTAASGVPVLSYAFEAAQKMGTHIIVYANCDIVLTPRLFDVIHAVTQRLNSFLVVGRRMDLTTQQVEEYHKALSGGPELTKLIGKMGQARVGNFMDYFIFKNGLYNSMPDLLVGRAYFDWWLYKTAMDSAGTYVVDASPSICAFHLNHDYSHVSGQVTTTAPSTAIRNGHPDTMVNARIFADMQGINVNVDELLEPGGLWSNDANLRFDRALDVIRPHVKKFKAELAPLEVHPCSEDRVAHELPPGNAGLGTSPLCVRFKTLEEKLNTRWYSKVADLPAFPVPLTRPYKIQSFLEKAWGQLHRIGSGRHRCVFVGGSSQAAFAEVAQASEGNFMSFVADDVVNLSGSLPWQPHFYVASSTKYVLANKMRINSFDAKWKVFPLTSDLMLHYPEHVDGVLFYRTRSGDVNRGFAVSPFEVPISEGGSSLHVALQLVSFVGCRNIVITGADFSKLGPLQTSLLMADAKRFREAGVPIYVVGKAEKGGKQSIFPSAGTLQEAFSASPVHD